MKEFIFNIYFILVIFFCILLNGCIVEWEAKDTDEVEGILAVEGLITDNESVITLSRSKGISYKNDPKDLRSPYRVTDAKVSIECDDGMVWAATGQKLEEYTIETGKLNPERQYRLKIEFEEHEYHSEFAYPMMTPEIDSVFWMKQGSHVNIYVASHAPDSIVQYYSWAFHEDWEYSSNLDGDHPFNPFYPDGFPFFCWDKAVGKELLLGSSEKTVSGKITNQLTEILMWDDKLSILYRIEVGQNAIRKRAYDYFENIKKNAEKTGNLFSPVPAELKGNIICTTDPARPVIGYIEVSSTTQKKLLINSHDSDGVYIRPIVKGCETIPRNLFFISSYYIQMYGGVIPDWFIVWDWEMDDLGKPTPIGYVDINCVDCTLKGGTTQKPADWPNDH